MKTTKSSIHCRSIVLLLFVVSWACWVSLETEAMDEKVLASRNDINGADSSEWFVPAEDAAVSGRRQGKTTSSKPQKTQPHRAVKTNKPAQAGSSNQVQPKTKPRKTVVLGDVYIITMNRCLNQSAPPFGKVGSSERTENNCAARVGELQTGNPHQLVCRYTFSVTEDPKTAERRVRHNLTEDGFNIYPSCRGGTEWFTFPGSRVQSLAARARAVLNDAGVLASTSDWVESSINSSLSPNQSPHFVYNSKWRQVPCKGDELQHIAYNCK